MELKEIKFLAVVEPGARNFRVFISRITKNMEKKHESSVMKRSMETSICTCCKLPEHTFVVLKGFIFRAKT